MGSSCFLILYLGNGAESVRALIGWALDSPLIVLLIAVALAGFGVFAFIHVNVESYPDPAPAIIEMVAHYDGASAQEIERQVTMPLEVTFAGMPGLKSIRSKSLFGLSHLPTSSNTASITTTLAGGHQSAAVRPDAASRRLAVDVPRVADRRDLSLYPRRLPRIVMERTSTHSMI